MITRDQWLAACAEAGVYSGEDDQSAVTIGEFGKMMDVSRATADRILRKLVEAGKAVQTTRRTRTGGRMISYVAFRLTEPEAARATPRRSGR